MLEISFLDKHIYCTYELIYLGYRTSVSLSKPALKRCALFFYCNTSAKKKI